ncbi:hypothetical protein [Pyrobaculum ferrireducens]|uniref:Glycoside hydrolase, family 43 n=1 Tax=Pyrobaculum ferrireducens TaxID=1104324 RepID=G7VI07_9CREN|nr:hypothetical protein [Pyrobaculum ferrireducens]AET33367.1 hypothetical protein P186_1966 [Pyrobaculum ferrireducens]
MFPLCEAVEITPVLRGIAPYAAWGSAVKYGDWIYMYVSRCEGSRSCSVVAYRSRDYASFSEVGVVLEDGLTAAPFFWGDRYYLVYVDRKRGNRVRLASSREPDSGFSDLAILATPSSFNAAEVDLGCNVYVRGNAVDVLVSNILPYPRGLWVLRFTPGGGFIGAWRLVAGAGTPGPWHSLHNASAYRVGDYYLLLSASNDYSEKPHRGYIVGFVMDRLYDVEGAGKFVLLDASAESHRFVGRRAVLGADTPSLLMDGGGAYLYLSVVDREAGGPWDIYLIKYRQCAYAY